MNRTYEHKVRRCAHATRAADILPADRLAERSATTMKDGAPFGIAGVWENWKEPASGEWIRTFAVITTDANEMVAASTIECRQSWRPATMSPG